MKHNKFLIILALVIFVITGYFGAKYVYHRLLDNIQLRVENIIEEKIDSINNNSNKAIKHYDFNYDWVNSSKYIAHAMGSIDGKNYTNSLEAFEYNYNLGHRIFEVDFYLTSDGRLVCCHDDNHWRKITGNDGEFTYDNFMSSKIYNKYTPLDCEGLIKLLSKYKDIYIVTDTKYTDELLEAIEFKEIVDTAKRIDPTVLDRIIPQIYTKEMLDIVMTSYPFKSIIFTLYQTSWEPKDIALFCYKSGVGYITTWHININEDNIKWWKPLNIYVGAHTVNDEEFAKELLNSGANNIYTDNLH